MKQPDKTIADIDHKTIADFGQQWTKFTENKGYYGSMDCLQDVFGPLLDVGALRGLKVGDIGSGTGRIVNMLLDAGVASVVAIEPSEAFHVLQRNVADRQDRLTLIHATGEAIPATGDLDLVVSIGVLHHIVDPSPIVRAAWAALKPGGRMLVWLYGREGNEIYLGLVNPLRALIKRLPKSTLSGLCIVLKLFAGLYIVLCRLLPLPMRSYILNHFTKLDRGQRILTIYDQLNPAYARYYQREEAGRLLTENGFTDVCLYHRHGYSWTVIGRHPKV